MVSFYSEVLKMCSSQNPQPSPDRTWPVKQRVVMNKTTAREDGRLHAWRNFVDVPEPKVPSFPDDCSMIKCNNSISRSNAKIPGR